MITGDIKNKIDALWEAFWTAGITNSLTVVEQMTYLLFMKLLDDKQMKEEQTANTFHTQVRNPVFPDGLWTNPDTGEQVPYNDLRWHVLKEKNADDIYKTISRHLFVFIKNINGTKETAYGKYMKNAVFLLTDPRKLQKIVDMISNTIDMNNRDTMGDVYEYVLGKMASSGTNGQFRTPRHIINLIVDLMQPTPDDTICDVAMGTAGFLMGGAQYVSQHYRKELLRPEVRKRYEGDMFHGYDNDETMLRIGAMNLLLHNITNPQIEKIDSLSVDNQDRDRYSLIMANPPFTGSLDKETVSKDLLTLTNTGKTELLFLSLMIRSLEPGGRCGSIVPDGVLFGTSKAHIAIRKELVDNQCLRAVISLPSGVFQPYSGVSTAILVFTKTNAGGTDKVWFYDMQADGYTLDQKRTPCEENDIPNVIQRFANLKNEEQRTRRDQSFLVPADEIRQNDYDLTFNKYKEVVREKVQYDAPDVILGRIDDLEKQIQEGQKALRALLSD